MSFLYFAFGSNLLRQRLQLQNPSAEFRDTAELKDHSLTFSNLGHNPRMMRWRGGAASIQSDVSGKSVWGCVWRLANEHRKTLDKQEGVYEAKDVTVTSATGVDYACLTYQLPAELLVPNQNDSRPSPMYLDVIVRGAKQNTLPQSYIDYLEALETNGSTESCKVYEETLKQLDKEQ